MIHRENGNWNSVLVLNARTNQIHRSSLLRKCLFSAYFCHIFGTFLHVYLSLYRWLARCWAEAETFLDKRNHRLRTKWFWRSTNSPPTDRATQTPWREAFESKGRSRTRPCGRNARRSGSWIACRSSASFDPSYSGRSATPRCPCPLETAPCTVEWTPHRRCDLQLDDTL